MVLSFTVCNSNNHNNTNMSETEKDHGIRLFGRKIPLPEFQIPANSGPLDTCSSTKKTEAEISCVENTEQQEKSQDLRDSKQDSQHNGQENEPIVDSMPAEDTRDEDKLLKKPDKILQCPRCNSLDTKFCYFNNYNVNQPRHFCKNCQRYWTAGGTMRNVPIGAGRRKNKQLASQYRQIIITSDGIPTTRLETTISTGHQQISNLDSSAAFRSSTTDTETVLKFGSDTDTPICESMESSMLNLRVQKRGTDGNSISCVEYREEPSLCVSSVTNSGTQGNELLSEHNNTSNWLQCYPVPPWVVPWNPNWNNVSSTTAVHNPCSTAPTAMQWCPTPMLAIPGISPPNISVQLVSAPYWSGAPMLAMGSRAGVSPTSSTSTSGCSGNGTPTLGKHTRDASFADEEKIDKSFLVQKVIRIDDPIKASKRVEHNGEGKDLVLGATKAA